VESIFFSINLLGILILKAFFKKLTVSSVSTLPLMLSPILLILFKSINKKLLSAYLIGKIISSDNFEFLDKHSIMGLIKQNRLYKGIRVRDVIRGVVKDLNSRIIVDASGSTAVIRRKLPENRFFTKEINSFDRAVVYEEIIEYDNKINNPKLLFDPSKLNAGYLWLYPDNLNNARIGLGVSGKSYDIKTLFQEYKNQLVNVKSNVLKKETGMIVLRRSLNSFVFKNVLLVGSSACQVNPLITRDFSYNLKGAYYASKAIISSLKEKEYLNTKALWSYNINYMREVGGKTAILECIRDFFASLSTPTFNYIIENNIIPADLIENIEGRIKKRDFLFNIPKLLLKPRLLHKFLKLSDYSTKMESLYNNYPSYEGFAIWKKKLNNEIRNIRKSFLV
jgi:flavin-dependent dehydrogenase